MARNAIDKVRSAYQARRRKHVVKEWDNLEMYFGPLTAEDMESVKTRVKDPDSDYEQNILLLIHKARDKEGKPLFAFGDKQVLMKESDLVVLQRAINFMWSGVPSLEEAREEVAENPTSDSDSV
jgi:hypothetical protein